MLKLNLWLRTGIAPLTRPGCTLTINLMMTLTSRMYKEEEKVSIIERFQVALSCTAIPPSPPSSINSNFNIETLVSSSRANFLLYLMLFLKNNK